MLLRQATPKGHFEAAEAGGGPDYSKTVELDRPARDFADDPSLWLPDGMTPAPRRDAAVFYIHPTTYLERDRWNAPLDAGGDTEFRTRLFVQSQASAFNAAGQVWAPRYRQAAFGAFLLESEDAEKALDFAYRDVAAAFDQFVREAGNRPIILAGHSQGALQLERLLREKIAGKPIARRIVAAYVVGWPISTTADCPCSGFRRAQTTISPAASSRGSPSAIPPIPIWCWNWYEHSTGFSGDEAPPRGPALRQPDQRDAERSRAARRRTPERWCRRADLLSATLEPGRVGAHCDKGLLILDGSIPPLGPYVLPGQQLSRL